MDRVSSKITSIALAAVLCFWMAFPVSSFVKPERAQANPAIAIPIIFGTAALVGGVAVAGTNSAAYDANLNSVCEGFKQATAQWSQSWNDYVSAQGSFEQAMSSCVTAEGNIQLQTLTDAGFFDSLNSYTAYCVQQGSMVPGTNSILKVTQWNLAGHDYMVSNAYPERIEEVSQYGNAQSAGWVYFVGAQVYSSNGIMNVKAYFSKSSSISATVADGYIDVRNLASVSYKINSSGNITNNNANLGQQQFKVYSTANSNYKGEYVNDTLEWDFGQNEVVASSGDAIASVNTGVTAPTSTVQPFTPTAEQLVNGFDSSAVVDAINSGTAETGAGIQQVISTLTGTIGSVLNDIKTASQTIEQALGGAISTTLTGIATGIAGVGTALGDIWGDLQGWYTDWLAWVGATPLGALIAQVIAALNAGVLDLAGLLELVNAGVLDLSTAIELVQTAVQTGVADITGAIEGIQFPSFEWPKVEGTPQVALPPGDMRSSMDAVIQDKAPFAYMYTFGEGIQSLEYSQEPKFRMRQTFDIVADEVEIDINAEPWLNRDIGGVTIAQLLRASVTLTLCMGLLYGAYRTAMAAVKAG